MFLKNFEWQYTYLGIFGKVSFNILNNEAIALKLSDNY